MATTTVTQGQPTLRMTLTSGGDAMRRIDTKAYLSSQSYEEMSSKVSTLVASTAIGAGAGAAIGSVTVVGAGPGAGIGAAAGFITGCVIVASWSSCEFKKWKENQSEEVVAATISRLSEAANNSQLICPITQEPPVRPVVTPYTKQVFDDRALKEWIDRTGEDPITHQPLSWSQVKIAPVAIGIGYKLCEKLRREEGQNIPAPELEGITMLEKDFDKSRTRYFESEKDILMDRIKRKEVSLRDAGANFKELCDLLDPKV